MAIPNVSAISLKLSSLHLFNTDICTSWAHNSGTPFTPSLSNQCTFKRGTELPLSHLFAAKMKKRRSYSERTSCKGKGEDSDTTSSGEGIILDEQTLERDLQIAIDEENYARAAKIRDSLRFLHTDSEAAVRAANDRFYDSFRKGDLATMQTLWAKRDNVCCVHPGVSGISGYDLVMGSWEFVCAEYEFPLNIQIKDVKVHVKGDVGYVTCIELVKTKGRDWGKQFATNLFEKIDGQWLICIHHASYVDL